MSEFKVEVVPVMLEKHPNADSLSIAKVWGYSCIVKTEQFQHLKSAAYCPVDTVVSDQPEFEFLKGKKRIRAMRLRGIYSEGLLIPARPHWQIGNDVTAELGCAKYEEPEEIMTQTENESWPGWMPKYTDIENYKRHSWSIKDKEQVIITCKIHGCCSSYAYHADRFWVCSHRCAKKYDERNMWWKVAEKYDLQNKLKQIPGFILYGEVYGQVQDLKYGAKPGELFFNAFDLYDINKHCYLEHDDFVSRLQSLDIPRVPLLYNGPFFVDLLNLAEGQETAFPDSGHVREGIVIKPIQERREHHGRVIYKFISEGYRLRKGGLEKH